MRSFIRFILIKYTFINSPIFFSYIFFVTGYIRATARIYYFLSIFKFNSIFHRKLSWKFCTFICNVRFYVRWNSFFYLFFILDNNCMPFFPKNWRNNCSFVSLLSVVLVCGSFVLLTFSFCSSFLTTFSCNAKRFPIAFLFLRLRVTQNALQLSFFFFCSLSPSRQCFWTDNRKFFKENLKISYRGGVGPRSDSFVAHTTK